VANVLSPGVVNAVGGSAASGASFLGRIIPTMMWDPTLLEIAMVATFVVGIPVIVRSVRSRTARPLGVSAAALMLGVVAIPVVSWLIRIITWVLSLIVWLARAIVRFIEWTAPVLKVLGWIIAGAIALALASAIAYGAWKLIRFVVENFSFALLLLVVGVVAVVLIGIYLGWWTAVLHVILAAGCWIGGIIGVVVKWILVAFLWLSGCLLLLGGAVAILGYPGYYLLESIISSCSAGSGQRHSISFAAGLGVMWSILLSFFSVAGLSSVPAVAAADIPGIGPVSWGSAAFGHVMPGGAYPALDRIFGNYDPTFDLILICVLAVMGIISYLAARGPWKIGSWAIDGVRSSISPALLLTGLAVAMAIPLLLLMGWVASKSND